MQRTPRRTPRQARSQQMVDDILLATRQLVTKGGLRALTTNGVARLAGVSIGSLYQYFPSKRALVAALREQHQATGERLIREHAARLATAPLEQAMRCFVEQMFAIHRSEPELHRALEQEREPGMTASERRSHEIIRAYLELHRSELCVQDLNQAAYVVGAAVESITHGAVLNCPELLQEGPLIEDLTRMLLAYLTGRVR